MIADFNTLARTGMKSPTRTRSESDATRGDDPRHRSQGRGAAANSRAVASAAGRPSGAKHFPGGAGGVDLRAEAAKVRTLRRRLPKASEALAEELLLDMVGRGLQAGDALPHEGDMMAKYGVGRSTVREALRILEINGLVVMRSGPQGGPKVREAGPADLGRMLNLFLQVNRVTVEELLRARRFLEPAVVADATRRQDPKFIRRVARLAQVSKAIDVNDDDEYLKLTREFHEAMVSASGNGVLSLLGLALMSMFWGDMDRGIFPPRQRRAILDEHDRILTAILDGDAAAAERLMTDHMDHYLKGIEKRQPAAFKDVIRWQ